MWKNELRDWVPATLFDAHVHLGPPEIVSPVSQSRKTNPTTTFTSLTAEEIKSLFAGLYGGVTVEGMIAFPFPLAEVDIEAANDYIVNLVKEDASIFGYILMDPENVKKAIEQYAGASKCGVRISGVKAHYDLIGKTCHQCPTAEYVTGDMLEFMNSEELGFMLHTSGIGMGDPVNQEFVLSIVSRFPRIKIILAHVGRYFEPEQFMAFMESEVPACPNIFLETSSVTIPEVYERILSEKSMWKKLIFGSDVPYGLITGVEYWSEDMGLSFITRDDYPWSSDEMQTHFDKQRKSLTHNTYHTINAVKVAIERQNLSLKEETQLKEDIFYNNARRGLVNSMTS
jgi:predicted TIM-barrel fold metal-dependent hydrolase